MRRKYCEETDQAEELIVIVPGNLKITQQVKIIKIVRKSLEYFVLYFLTLRNSELRGTRGREKRKF